MISSLFTARTLAISCLSAALLRTARACDGFTNPTLPDLSVTWKMGEQVDIHWDVNSLSYVDLILRHWGSDYIATLLKNATNVGSTVWTVGDGDNVTTETIEKRENFVLILQDPDGTAPDVCGWVDNQLQSPGFKLEATSTTSSSTSSTPTTSSTTSSSATTTSAPASTTSTPPATSTAAAEQAGLSTGAEAGIGVGVGVAVLLFIGALVLFFFTRRKRSKQEGVGEIALQDKDGDHGSQEPLQPHYGYSELYQQPKFQPQTGFAELTSQVDSQELDSQPMRYEMEGDSTVGSRKKP